MMNFIFYDTETTGTDTTFDQILQFAAILTDDDLNELDRFETRCRLLPHVIPAPGALLATRITPAILTDPSLPSHYQAMRQIADKLNAWSPAIFIGYNTLAFDEPLLRQAFYQTLQPVYLTNTHGNSRPTNGVRSGRTKQSRSSMIWKHGLTPSFQRYPARRRSPTRSANPRPTSSIGGVRRTVTFKARFHTAWTQGGHAACLRLQPEANL